MLENIILVLHVMAAVVMIGLILLQQGKGAEMGASFGSGSSQTVFGAAGSASFLTKLTWGLALFFFTTSLVLAIFAHQRVQAAGTTIPGLDVAPVSAPTTLKPMGDHAAGSSVQRRADGSACPQGSGCTGTGLWQVSK